MWSLSSHTFMLSSISLKGLFYDTISITDIALAAEKKMCQCRGVNLSVERLENDE